MSNVNITKSAFEYNGIRYFRAGREDLALVFFDEKKLPITKPNYLAKKETVSPANLAGLRSMSLDPIS